MSLVSAIRPARKTWLTVVVLAQVITGLAALVSIATSPLIGVLTAAVLALITVIVRSLIIASRQLDRIFEEELDSSVQRRPDVSQDATHS